MVETPLSENIVASLEIDPATELLCADHDFSSPTTLGGDLTKKRHQFPLLALYSASSLWLLTITYTSHTKSSTGPKLIVKGKLSNIQEPYEETLLSCHSSTRIIRVRSPASLNAQNRNTVLCPPGCMAMLTSEGAIILNHYRSARSDATSQQFRRKKEVSKTRYGFHDLDDSDDDDTIPHPRSTMETSYYTTTPIYLGLGGDDSDIDPITDFCFGDSSHDIFSIYILKSSGNVYSANPILFDGTAIPRTSFQERIQQLNLQLDCMESSFQQDSAPTDATTITPLILESRMPEKEENCMDLKTMIRSKVYKEAQIRRIKAEKQFLMDSFPDHANALINSTSIQKTGYYITSCLRGNGGTNATLWPVQFQGPLLYGRTVWTPKSDTNSNVVERPCAAAMAIQTIHSTYIDTKDNSKQHITFVIVGRLKSQVDICALSRPVEGRFGFESIEDASVLDNRIIGYGAVLETIGFQEEPNQYSHYDLDAHTNEILPFSSPPPSSSSSSHRRNKNRQIMMSLLVDSVISSRNEQLIHYMSHSGVFTISTSIFYKTLKKIKKNAHCKPGVPSTALSIQGGKESPEKSSTTAWSCLSVGSGAFLSGAVVSGDPSLGHILVAQISSGSMEVVNLTSAQYLHRAAIMPKTSEHPSHTKKNETIDSIPPFAEDITPLLQKIQKSFSSTGKMTGSKIYPKDAGPTSVAFVLETTQKLQSEIVVPLHEIYDKTESHKKALLVLYKSQKKKLESLQSMMDKVKQNHKKSISKFTAIEKNAHDLKIRSASILEASRSTNPKISQAEYEYFTQLKRWELQTNKWGYRLENIQNKVRMTQENKHEHILESKSNDDDETGSLQCFLNLSEEQKHMCSDLLRGQGVLLKKSKDILTSVERDAREMMEKKGLTMENGNVIQDN